MQGYTEIVKCIEKGLKGNPSEALKYANQYFDKYPNGELYKPIFNLINNINPLSLLKD